MQNGGFEQGSTTGWVSSGVGQGGTAIASSAMAHSGSYSAQLGVRSLSAGAHEPAGDNCLYQAVSFSGAHKLSFYFAAYSAPGDSIAFDWQEAYFRPFTASGCGEIGTRIFKFETSVQPWMQSNATVSGPGQIYFDVHGDGRGNPAMLNVDDVSIH